MSFQLVLQSEAIVDMQKAFEWYEARKPGLGYEFIEKMEDGSEKVCNHLLHYTAINNQFRRLKVSRFPYLTSVLK
jgi:toxin ParE1/3/4